MRTPLVRMLRTATPGLIALALGSCGPARNEFAPACPVPGIPKQLSELVRYRSASADVRELIVSARIVDVLGKCKPGDRGELVATAQVRLEVTRGLAMQGPTYDLPLFVAVTDSNAIRDKTLYALRVAFEGNQDTVRAATQEIEMVLPVSPQKSGAAYGIIAGFQLTPEEVVAVRRNARR